MNKIKLDENYETEISDDLVSLLLVHCAEPIQVGLRGSNFAGHAQA